MRELSDAQAYLSGSFPLTIETPNEIATQILNVVFLLNCPKTRSARSANVSCR
jgi:hypothetical protein